LLPPKIHPNDDLMYIAKMKNTSTINPTDKSNYNPKYGQPVK
jgi:hypothetical protein